MDNFDNFLEIGKAHGLELGVDDDAVDGDLEGGSPSDLADDFRLRNLLHDTVAKIHKAGTVTSGTAVFNVDFDT